MKAKAKEKEKKTDDLGIRIQMLRKRCGLSIRQLAAQAGVTAGMISFIERGKSSPSISLLRQILDALGTDLHTFFGSTEAKTDGVVFLREGMQVVMDPERRYTMVFPRKEGVDVQMLDEVFTPRAKKPPLEKFPCAVAGYILSGQLILEVKGRPVKTLRPGDAFYVPADTEHRGYAAPEEPVRLITVYSPARY
jgi:transcriptional regulator with XRE-family HTH domain